jgi:glucokinase
MEHNLLVADIGGTSSRFARFSTKDGKLELCETTWLKTAESESFAELLSTLRDSDFSISASDADYCVFAIAGAVEGGVRCSPPNIPWSVDLSSSEEEFGISSFALINDFLAQAFASRSPLSEVDPILPGLALADGAIAVVGAGTGLGKAALFPDGHGGYVGGPSEGGHTNFCVESQREFEFSEFVKNKIGVPYTVWDTVVSGRGLSLIHEFLTSESLEPKDVAEKALSKDTETLEWAARFYGRVARNFALETFALGGVFIAGGVASKNPSLLTHPEFERSFRTSAKYEDLLAGIPVTLIDNQESGLWGAAYYGLQELRRL